jgi:hypothetical protein
MNFIDITVRSFAVFAVAIALNNHPLGAENSPLPPRQTVISIVGDQFCINGRPTYFGRSWRGRKVEGLLFNARMVQGIFDDLNSQTAVRWIYPDTRTWDPERNTREFVGAMPEWRRHGPARIHHQFAGRFARRIFQRAAVAKHGNQSGRLLAGDYLRRLTQILDRADALGMVAIVGYFYFGQDERLRDEAAIIRAVDSATDWLAEHRYSNVLVEINNECNVRYDHDILKPERVHDLILRVKNRQHNGARFLVGTSYGGGTIPGRNVIEASDFLLLHGNGVSDPHRIAEMVRATRAVPGYTAKPILFNEDDHFQFDQPMNNFVAALSEYASWGYFDPGKSNYVDGYQSPPVRWELNTERKRQFFQLLAEITGESVSGEKKE